MALRHIGRAVGRMVKMHLKGFSKRNCAADDGDQQRTDPCTVFFSPYLFFFVCAGRSVGRLVHPSASVNESKRLASCDGATMTTTAAAAAAARRHDTARHDTTRPSSSYSSQVLI